MNKALIGSLTAVAALTLVGCSDQYSNAPAGSTGPAITVLDRFDGPDGEITVFCRKGDKWVDKDGHRSGNILLFEKHDDCKGK